MTEHTTQLIARLENHGFTIHDKDLLATVADLAYRHVEPLYHTRSEFPLSDEENRELSERALEHLLRSKWIELKRYIPRFLNRVLGIETRYLSEASRLFLFLFLIGQVHWLEPILPFKEHTLRVSTISWESLPNIIATLRNDPQDIWAVRIALPIYVFTLCIWPAWMREELELGPYKQTLNLR